MSILGNDLLLGSGDEGYNLTRSLRFRSSASAYLNRTYSNTQTNAKIQTLSWWAKRGTLGAVNDFFGAYDGTSVTALTVYFAANDTFNFDFGGASTNTLTTTQVFRDPSAWYHFVLAIDTTQATASNRYKLYVNGAQITAFSTANYVAQNADSPFGKNNANNRIGTNWNNASQFLDGYMTEVNFIDGQALTPSSFGSTNATTGVWQPARYTGTYGTNGFYLKFTDNSTAAALGTDFSGNSNTWTTNNISVTAGVTYDSMTDVPTLTSATAANFCVLNPLDKQTDISVAQGNLQISTTAGIGNKQIRGSIALPSSGKFYWETKNTGSVNNFNMGLTTTTASLSVEGAGDMFYNEGGTIGNNGTNSSGYATLALNDTVGVAVDIDANKIYWYKNNTLVNSGGTTINITAPFAPMFGLYDNGNAQSITFGQRPFTYTAPSGYVALNTFNLPTSTILKGNTVMDATLYTGTGASLSVTNTASFKPDLVWYKGRSTAYNHSLFDSVRGATKQLISNTTDAEATLSGVTAFNSNGFSLGSDANGNNNGTTYVGWQWQAGQGTTSSNTSGTITSTVSVNASAGFSVVTYTGNNINPSTVGHGLGVAPSLIIFKPRNTATYNWNSYHISLGNTQFIPLNTDSAASSSVSLWNNTSPTSTVFTINHIAVNTSTTTYVAYCWTPIAGYSAFGSYSGNNSTDGTFVYTGFRPKFVMIKEITSGGTNWNILDTSRDPYNVEQNFLAANSSAAESTLALLDGLSNGFKLRSSGLAVNASGSTYIYMAFAENPFKNALAR